MKILILNTHSILNSGDAAIVLSQIQLFKKIFFNLRITLTSRTPEIDERVYGKMGIKVFPPLLPAPSVFDGSIEKIRRSLRNLLAFESKKNLLEEIRKSDVVISSGGGYFYSNRKFFPGPMFFQNYLHIKIASALNKPIIFFPQSFGPVYNSMASKMLKNMLESNKIVKIFAREEISYHFLKGLLDQEKNREKIDICPDMAFYLNQEAYPKGSHEIALNLPRPIIAMTLRQWDFPETKNNQEKRRKQERYLDTFKEICSSMVEARGGSVVIFPQVKGPGDFENDRIISRQLWDQIKESLPRKNLLFLDHPDPLSPFYIIDLLSQVDLIIATRFHSAIFALISGIPVVSITYQPKSRGIMKSLGLEHFCVDITHISSVEVLELIGEILGDRTLIQNKIREKICSIKEIIEMKLENSICTFL